MVIKNSTREIPVVGPWISRIGRVQRIMSSQCSIDPEIWVYAYFHSVPRLAVSLLKPTAFDLATERFEAGHKKKRKRKYHVTDTLQDNSFKVGKAAWAVFRLGEWAERLGWYMLVFDAATQLAIDWTSMAYQWSGCKSADNPWGNCAMNDVVTRFIDGGYTALWTPADNNRGIIASVDKITCIPGMTATPFINMTVSRPPPPYTPAQTVVMQLVDLASGWEGPPIRYDLSKDESQTERVVYQDWNYGGPRRDYRVKCIQMDGVALFRARFGVNGYIERGMIGDP